MDYLLSTTTTITTLPPKTDTQTHFPKYWGHVVTHAPVNVQHWFLGRLLSRERARCCWFSTNEEEASLTGNWQIYRLHWRVVVIIMLRLIWDLMVCRWRILFPVLLLNIHLFPTALHKSHMFIWRADEVPFHRKSDVVTTLVPNSWAGWVVADCEILRKTTSACCTHYSHYNTSKTGRLRGL